MFKKYFQNKIELSIFGVNLKRLIKNFYKSKIDVFNLKQVSFKNIILTINYKNYKQAKKLLKDYEYKITNRFGANYLVNFATKRLGLVVGVVLFFIAIFLNGNYLSKIYIYGTSKIDNNEIINYLTTLGIKQNSFFCSVDVELLEKSLENHFSDISLVSMIKKGTNIIINIKEKITIDEVMVSGDITSQFDGQILEINLIQGRPLFEEGDIVKKGDILVKGETIINGKIVECRAIANIKMNVWYQSSYNFIENEIIKKRTGRVKENSNLTIFNKCFTIKNNTINFKSYEKEYVSHYLFDKNILPIKINKEKFYEIEEILVKNEFLNEKDDIIYLTKENALKQVPKDCEVTDIKTEIVDTENGKIVTTYLLTVQEF